MVKKKTAWRKEINLSALEEDISNEREKERLLGSAANESLEMPSSLFIIDKKGDEKVRKQVKRMRIDEILNPSSKISAPASRIRPKKADEWSKKRMIKVPKKLVQKYATRTEVKEEKKKSDESLPSSDIWARKEAVAMKEEDYVPDPSVIVPVKRRSEIKPLKNGSVSVKVAHQGSSYRPEADAYMDLVKTIVDEEEEKTRVEEKYKSEAVPHKVIREMKNIDLDGIHELLVPASEFKHDAVASDNENDGDAKVVYHAAQTKRKTRSQRNKEKEQKERMLSLEEEKEMLALEKQVENMERIEAELRKKDKKRKSEKESDLKPSKKQRLGKFKFEPELVPVHLPEQLADSLRNLKPEGSIFTDRFKSLQERGIIEPRMPTAIRPKYRRKFFELRSKK